MCLTAWMGTQYAFALSTYCHIRNHWTGQKENLGNHDSEQDECRSKRQPRPLVETVVQLSPDSHFCSLSGAGKVTTRRCWKLYGNCSSWFVPLGSVLSQHIALLNMAVSTFALCLLYKRLSSPQRFATLTLPQCVPELLVLWYVQQCSCSIGKQC